VPDLNDHHPVPVEFLNLPANWPRRLRFQVYWSEFVARGSDSCFGIKVFEVTPAEGYEANDLPIIYGNEMAGNQSKQHVIRCGILCYGVISHLMSLPHPTPSASNN